MVQGSLSFIRNLQLEKFERLNLANPKQVLDAVSKMQWIS